MRTIGAIILAAGKGKRMQLDQVNKVTMSLADKPMIRHIVDFMHRLAIETIVVVVGYAKESVVEVLKQYEIIYAEQTEQLGTGHAVQVAIEQLPPFIKNVLVVYGDDAVLYAEKHVPTIRKLFDKHYGSDAAITFLTVEQDNPYALGRIVRDKEGKVHAIIEEKDATEAQRKIKEINPGCFVFSVAFLKKYLPQVEKSSATGEYYLTSLIDLAFQHGEVVETVQGGKMAWRGVNTPEELQAAEKLYKSVHE
jgi:bifunctional UDP-N-acetylglucosamine pyrophosphorylase / glucosamine-1-phosphate N-acetyltransferase